MNETLLNITEAVEQMGLGQRSSPKSQIAMAPILNQSMKLIYTKVFALKIAVY